MMNIEEQTIKCQAGLKAGTPAMPQPSIWIKSPRTGRVVSWSDGWRCELGRVWSKIVAAAAAGQRTVAFTREELATVGALVKREDELRAAPRVRFCSRSWSR